MIGPKIWHGASWQPEQKNEILNSDTLTIRKEEAGNFLHRETYFQELILK